MFAEKLNTTIQSQQCFDSIFGKGHLFKNKEQSKHIFTLILSNLI